MFSLATRLMNRVSYAKKFLLILLVFMVPFFTLSADKLCDLYAEYSDARREQKGLEILIGYVPVYVGAAQLAMMRPGATVKGDTDAKNIIARLAEVSSAAVSGMPRLSSSSEFSLPNVEITNVDPGLVRFTNQSADRLYDAARIPLQSMLADMKHVAASSGVLQDHDSVVYRSMDTIFSSLLPLHSVLTQSASYTGYVTAYGYLDSMGKNLFLAQSDRFSAFLPAPGTAPDETTEANQAAAQGLEIFNRLAITPYASVMGVDKNRTATWLEKVSSFDQPLQSVRQGIEGRLIEVKERLNVRAENAYRQLLVVAVGILFITMLIFYLFAGFFISVKQAVADLSRAMEVFSAGDLRLEVSTEARDELGQLAAHFNTMRMALATLVTQIVHSTSTTTTQAQALSSGASVSLSGVSRQATELHAVTTSMSQLVISAQEVSRYSLTTSKSANGAGERCREGQVQVSHAVSGISKLFHELEDATQAIQGVSVQSQEITKSLAMIKSVSQQTNLLALNAAIEAARAGEQGRGFAVVADEVRHLAIRSHQLTEQIYLVIDHLHAQVEHAVRTINRSRGTASETVERVKDAEEIFKKITASIHEIVDNNVQIATGAEQQRQVVEGVDSSLASVKGHGEFNALEAKRMVQASAQVTEMLSRLNQLVSKFRVD